MRFGIMGAGAVGCYYGALLALAGHAVTLVGRPRFVDEVAERGLRLETAARNESVRVDARPEASALSDCDVILFCVKSTDTETAGAAMAPHLKPEATILSFQNGLGNVERLERVLGRAVVPSAVYVAAEIVSLGHVRHHGRGDVVIGSSAASGAIAQAFSAAGILATMSDNVHVDLWGKLAVNCAYNALSAVSRRTYGSLIKVEGVSKVMAEVFEECVAVARAEGVVLPPETWAGILRIAEAMPNQYSSTAQDLMRGKPTEIDHLNGYVVRRGEHHAIPTPTNRALQVMVKLAETSPRE